MVQVILTVLEVPGLQEALSGYVLVPWTEEKGATLRQQLEKHPEFKAWMEEELTWSEGIMSLLVGTVSIIVTVLSLLSGPASTLLHILSVAGAILRSLLESAWWFT